MTPSDVTNGILQLIGSPAWSGAWTTIGVTVSTAISIIAFRKSTQRPQIRTSHRSANFKKKVNEIDRMEYSVYQAHALKKILYVS